MKRFYIEAKETHVCFYEVDADTEEDALLFLLESDRSYLVDREYHELERPVVVGSKELMSCRFVGMKTDNDLVPCDKDRVIEDDLEDGLCSNCMENAQLGAAFYFPRKEMVA